MKDFHRNRDAAQGFSPDILFLPCIFPHFLQTAGPFGLLLSFCLPPFTMNLQERPQTLVGRSPVRSHTLPLLQQICVNRWTKYMKHQAIHCNTNTSDGKALKKNHLIPHLHDVGLTSSTSDGLKITDHYTVKAISPRLHLICIYLLVFVWCNSSQQRAVLWLSGVDFLSKARLVIRHICQEVFRSRVINFLSFLRQWAVLLNHLSNHKSRKLWAHRLRGLCKRSREGQLLQNTQYNIFHKEIGWEKRVFFHWKKAAFIKKKMCSDLKTYKTTDCLLPNTACGCVSSHIRFLCRNSPNWVISKQSWSYRKKRKKKWWWWW